MYKRVEHNCSLPCGTASSKTLHSLETTVLLLGAWLRKEKLHQAMGFKQCMSVNTYVLAAS